MPSFVSVHWKRLYKKGIPIYSIMIREVSSPVKRLPIAYRLPVFGSVGTVRVEHWIISLLSVYGVVSNTRRFTRFGVSGVSPMCINLRDF